MQWENEDSNVGTWCLAEDEADVVLCYRTAQPSAAAYPLDDAGLQSASCPLPGNAFQDDWSAELETSHTPHSSQQQRSAYS